MVVPSSMPAGMVTDSFFWFRTVPLPRHFWQGLLTIRPVPPHRGQAPVDWNTPKAVRCCVRTVPVPPQSGQDSALVPGAAPVPAQSGQASTREMVISFWQPKAASSKATVSRTRRLSPRWGPLRAAPRVPVPPPKPPKPKPEKISPKISPRSPKSPVKPCPAP